MLEQIQPEPRLSAVHTEAIKLLRAYITWINFVGASALAAGQGDLAKSQEMGNEAESWWPVVQSLCKS